MRQHPTKWRLVTADCASGSRCISWAAVAGGHDRPALRRGAPATAGVAADLSGRGRMLRSHLPTHSSEILKCPYKSKPEENKEKEHLHYGPTVDAWAVGVMTCAAGGLGPGLGRG